MMKRICNISLVILSSFFMGGCTLMMDEMDKDEVGNVDLEEVGFDEPYTEKTEFGDVTFQYGDSTQVLRQSALDYLVDVEGDSVLYFSDNIPKDLLVPEGMYVSMGCNEKLRHGLCSRVLSLTKENGMYRMETSRVSQTKVYKQFDVDIRLDYDQQMAFDPENYLDEQDVSMMENDTVPVFTDWAFFGKDVVERKEAQIRRRIQAKRALTRADDDDEEGEEGDPNYSPDDFDTHIVESKEKSMRIFTFNMKKLEEWPAPFSKLPEKGLMASLTCWYHEKAKLQHVQKIRSGQDYVKDVYDETPYMSFKLKAGWSKKKFDSNESLKNVYNKLYEGFNNKFEKKGISAGSFMVHLPIPITGGAVELFVRVAPRVTIGFGILGEVEFTKHLGKIHKEVEYINGKAGKKVFNPNEDENNDFEFKTFDLYGEFSVDAAIEILAGAAVAGGAFGLGIGFELGANFTFKREVDLPRLSVLSALKNWSGGIDPYKAFANFEIFFKPKIKAFAQSPAGKEWAALDWSIPGCKEKYTIFGPKTWHYYPQVDKPQGMFVIKGGSNGAEAEITGSYKFSDLNIGGLLGDLAYSPGVILSRVTTNGTATERTPLKTLTSSQSMNTKDVYSFSYVDEEYRQGCYYEMMPILYNVLPGTDDVLYSKHVINCVEDSYSELTYLDLFQQRYDEYEEDGEEVADQDFVVQAFITNPNKISSWKEWGVILSLEEFDKSQGYGKWVPSFDKEGKEFLEKKFPIKKTINKNTVSIMFTIFGYQDVDYRVTAHLYYVDENGYREVLTHPNRFTDEEEDDIFADPLSKGWLLLTSDMTKWGSGGIGSHDQVIKMGDI